jgi:hypothetical protein
VIVWPILGVAVAAYATWSLERGEVRARDGWWTSRVRRDDRPRDYWTAIACWFALAALLLLAP